MIVTIVAVFIMIFTAELWLPLAFFFGLLKLITTFSISAAWDAAKSVPAWVWDFAISLFS